LPGRLDTREALSTVLILSNRFGFATIAETMEYADEDLDYSESSNEVNDEDNPSPLLTMLLMSPLQLMNPLIGVKSMMEPLMSLIISALNHIPIYQSVPLSTNLLLSFFSSVYTESDQECLKEIAKEGRQKLQPSTIDYYECRDSLQEEVSN
jgi:hypothetical protein